MLITLFVVSKSGNHPNSRQLMNKHMYYIHTVRHSAIKKNIVDTIMEIDHKHVATWGNRTQKATLLYHPTHVKSIEMLIKSVVARIWGRGWK